MREQKKENYMFSEQDLKRLILPLLMEQLLAMLVGMVDSIMVSSAGEAAVSAVSLVDTLFVLMINVFTALATGGAVICGQYLGKKRPRQACEAADQLVLATGGLSILVMAVMYIFRIFVLNVVFGHIEPDVWENCNIYYLIVTASIPFISLYNAGAAIFRAQGDSKTPMNMSLIMNGINIVGNAVLLYGLKMGIAGAAIPTLLSRMFAAVAILLQAYKPDKELHLSLPVVWRPNRMILKKILQIGLPNCLENSMFQLGKILVLSLVTEFGTAAIAANAVANTLAVFLNLPGVAIGNAILTVCAQCAGANAYDQVRYYTRRILKIIYIGLWISCAGTILLMTPVLQVYNLSPEATEMTKIILVYTAVCMVLVWPLSFSLPNTLRAANDVNFCMIVSIASMWTFRIGFSYVLGRTLQLGVLGVWIAMTIDWVVRSVFFVARYVSGKWQKTA